MAVIGCANWDQDSSLDVVLKKPPPAFSGDFRQSVALDVEFVNLNVDQMDGDAMASLWQWVDETPLDVKLRKRYLSNGMQIGVVSNDTRFRERLQSFAADPDVIDAFMESAAVASDISHGEKRIPMRIGKRYELPLRQPILGDHVAMVRVDNKTIGRTLDDAQYLMALYPIALTGQKQIHLRIRPEIQYGQMRQKYVGADAAMRIVQQRESWEISSLDLNLQADEGDSIVIAPTWPLTGLAKQMLSGTNNDNQTEQVVLLIRVARVPTAIDQL